MSIADYIALAGATLCVIIAAVFIVSYLFNIMAMFRAGYMGAVSFSLGALTALAIAVVIGWAFYYMVLKLLGGS